MTIMIIETVVTRIFNNNYIEINSTSHFNFYYQLFLNFTSQLNSLNS